MLFVALCIAPNIGSKTDKNSNIEKMFILSRGEIVKQNIYNDQKQPLGILTRWIIHAKINISIYYNCTFSYTPMGNDFFNVLIITERKGSQDMSVCKIKCEPYFLPSFEKTYQNFFVGIIMYLKNPKTNLTTPTDANGGYIEGDAILLQIPRF